MRYKVCPVCEGEGKVAPPWVFTGDELAEQGPEFAADYASGAYDVACRRCHGQRVVEADPAAEARFAAEEAEALDDVRVYALESGDPELYYNPRLGL
jgi:hypothetical protein